MSNARVIDRQTLNDWICNDGLTSLFEEGYLSPQAVEFPDDPEITSAVREAYDLYQAYDKAASKVQKLVDEALE